jgi:hypothetical protein
MICLFSSSIQLSTTGIFDVLPLGKYIPASTISFTLCYFFQLFSVQTVILLIFFTMISFVAVQSTSCIFSIRFEYTEFFQLFGGLLLAFYVIQASGDLYNLNVERNSQGRDLMSAITQIMIISQRN